MPKTQGQRAALKQRHGVAAEAARIMATEGQRNFLLAKQKAARRLGLSDRHGLPSNAEVELALQEWQALYGSVDQTERLHALRRIAAATMRWLADFSPRLVGPVLTGTADEFSAICLHVFVEDPDQLVHFFMEQGVDFQQKRRRIRWHNGQYNDVEVLVIERQGALIELMSMLGSELKQAPPCPVSGRPQARAKLAEVEALLSGHDSVPAPAAAHSMRQAR